MYVMQQLAMWKRQVVYASHNLMEWGKEFVIILNLIAIVGKEIILLSHYSFQLTVPVAFLDSAKCIYLVFLIRQNSTDFRRIFFFFPGIKLQDQVPYL